MIELEDGVKLYGVELRVYYKDGTSRKCDFFDSERALMEAERDFKERFVSDVRIIPVYNKGEK